MRRNRLAGTVAPSDQGRTARGWRAYVWNNVPGWGAEDLAYRLANGGFEVVLCPVTNLYFDLAWNQNPEERGLDWGGFVDLRKPFQFVPYDYYRNVRLDRRGQPFAGATRQARNSRTFRRGVRRIVGDYHRPARRSPPAHPGL